MPAERSSPLFHFMLSGITLALYGLSRVIFNAVGFRYFGPEAVGAVNVAMSTAVLLSMPATAGLFPAYTRYVALTSDDARRGLFAWTAMLLLPLVALSALCFVFPVGPLASFTALWVGLYSFYSLARADQFAANRPGGAVALELSSFCLFLGALFASAYLELPAALAFSVYLVPALLYCIQSCMVARRLQQPGTGFWKFGFVSFLGSLPSLGVLYGSTIAMSLVGGLAAAGVWAALVSLVSPVLLVPRTLNSVFMPKLAAASPSSVSSDVAAWVALKGSHRRLAAALSPVLVCLALGLAGPLVRATLDRPPTATESLWWLLVVLSMYAAVRLEPLITCLAALGQNGIATVGSFAGGAACLVCWIVGAAVQLPTLIPLGYLVSAAVRLVVLQVLLARQSEDLSNLRESATASDVVVLLSCCTFALGKAFLVLTAGTALALFLCWREVALLRAVFASHQHAFRARS